MQDQPYKPTPEQQVSWNKPPPGLGGIFGPTSSSGPSRPRQRYRPGKSDGTLIAWSLLCGILAILALEGTDSGLAFWAVFALWGVIAWPLMIVYLIARAGRRRCPVCGTHLQTGPTRCSSCGHDFAAAARG